LRGISSGKVPDDEVESHLLKTDQLDRTNTGHDRRLNTIQVFSNKITPTNQRLPTLG